MVDAAGDRSMMMLSRLRGWRSRKGLLGISVTVLVVVVGCYALWSRHVWAQYAPSYIQWHQTAKSDIKKIIELPVANEKDQGALLVQLESVSQRINSEQSSVCQVSAAVTWQQRFAAEYRDAQVACRNLVANAVAFQKQLNIVTAYIADDHRLAKISASALPPSEVSDVTWDAQVELWGQAVNDVQALTVSAAFKPTQQVAVEKSTAVKAAWEELITAHQSKDKARYITAQSTLGASYDGLNAISLNATENLSKLTTRLKDVYIEAFS